MADIVLFGATGFTGRLAARALSRRSTSFALCGRNRSKLESLAAGTGASAVHVAEVDDVDALVRALDGARVLITCVGPFAEMGDTAAEAAIRAGCHYIDSTGEGLFIDHLYEQYDARARSANIVMAPAMGFDEVPADVASTLAAGGMESAELILTYAVPTTGSRGTFKSAIGIIAGTGRWIEHGRPRAIRTGEETRWAPMPQPLGPRPSVAMPLAIGYLAPRHLDLDTLKVFATSGRAQRLAMAAFLPPLRFVRSLPLGKKLIEAGTGLLPEGPEGDGRDARWTVLAEARSASDWRNVVITGKDVYGLTAETLASAANVMNAADYSQSGVLSPVEAVGLDTLEALLSEQQVVIERFDPD